MPPRREDTKQRQEMVGSLRALWLAENFPHSALKVTLMLVSLSDIEHGATFGPNQNLCVPPRPPRLNSSGRFDRRDDAEVRRENLRKTLHKLTDSHR